MNYFILMITLFSFNTLAADNFNPDDLSAYQFEKDAQGNFILRTGADGRFQVKCAKDCPGASPIQIYTAFAYALRNSGENLLIESKTASGYKQYYSVPTSDVSQSPLFKGKFKDLFSQMSVMNADRANKKSVYPSYASLVKTKNAKYVGDVNSLFGNDGPITKTVAEKNRRFEKELKKEQKELVQDYTYSKMAQDQLFAAADLKAAQSEKNLIAASGEEVENNYKEELAEKEEAMVSFRDGLIAAAKSVGIEVSAEDVSPDDAIDLGELVGKKAKELSESKTQVNQEKKDTGSVNEALAAFYDQHPKSTIQNAKNVCSDKKYDWPPQLLATAGCGSTAMCVGYARCGKWKNEEQEKVQVVCRAHRIEKEGGAFDYQCPPPEACLNDDGVVLVTAKRSKNYSGVTDTSWAPERLNFQTGGESHQTRDSAGQGAN